MRHLGLFAFGLTTCVLVPTILHAVDAGPNQVAKLVAPGARTITIGQTKIEVALDRAFVDAGAKVHVKLTASAETARRVNVDILVLESTGTSGGRVETPPVRIARETVALDTKGDGATKTLAFTLPGGRAQTMEGLEPFGAYTILVMPTADADKFERLRRRAATIENPMMADPGNRVGDFDNAFRTVGAPAPGSDVADADGADAAAPDPDAPPKFGAPGQIARLEVNTRPANSAITIESPDTAIAGFDLVVKVHVHNRSKKPAKVSVGLAAKSFYLGDDYRGINSDLVTISGGTDDTDADGNVALAGGATKDVEFHVMTQATGTLGLFANVRCNDDCYSDAGKRALTDSAVDAVDIVSGEAHPTVVVK